LYHQFDITIWVLHESASLHHWFLNVLWCVRYQNIKLSIKEGDNKSKVISSKLEYQCL